MGINTSINASIGNVDATKNKSLAFRVFNNLNFITIWLYGISGIFYMIYMNSFIRFWIGEEYILKPYYVLGYPIEVSYLLGFVIILTGFKNFYSTFRYSTGLIKDFQYIPLVASFVNIFISIILAPKYGIHGVIMGTIVSGLLSFILIDPYVILKRYFNQSTRSYWLRNMLPSFVLLTLNFFIVYKFVLVLPPTSFVKFILSIILMLIFEFLFVVIFNLKNENLVFLKKLTLSYSMKLINKFSDK